MGLNGSRSVMIVNVRGTSGSGKSTVVRNVMKSVVLPLWLPHYVEGRRNPLYYTCEDVAVVGHYESPCGGCDTIQGYAKLTGLILDLHRNGFHVIAEGLLLSEDTKQTLAMVDDIGKNQFRIIFLSTPIGRCLTRIRNRRLAAGNAKPLKTDNTVNRVRTIERARDKLKAAGIRCYNASSRSAHQLILRWLENSHGS